MDDKVKHALRARQAQRQSGVFESRGKLYMRVTIAPSKRPAVQLVGFDDRTKAEERGLEVNALAQLLRDADKHEHLPTLLEQGGTLPEERMPELRAIVEGIVAGVHRPKHKPLPRA